MKLGSNIAYCISNVTAKWQVMKINISAIRVRNVKGCFFLADPVPGMVQKYGQSI